MGCKTCKNGKCGVTKVEDDGKVTYITCAGETYTLKESDIERDDRKVKDV